MAQETPELVSKISAFGLLKRGGLVHAIAIRDVRTDTLSLIIVRKSGLTASSAPMATILNDRLDVSEFHPVRINRSKLFIDGTNHINSIENFWSQEERHLRE